MPFVGKVLRFPILKFAGRGGDNHGFGNTSTQSLVTVADMRIMQVWAIGLEAWTLQVPF